MGESMLPASRWVGGEKQEQNLEERQREQEREDRLRDAAGSRVQPVKAITIELPVTPVLHSEPLE